MAGLLDLLRQELGGNAIGQLSNHIGADPGTTQTAVAAAVPELLGGMAQTAQQPGGEGAIHEAAQEHAGFLGNLTGLLGRAPADVAPGGGVLERILGDRQGQVQEHVAHASGLAPDQTKRLLMVLAPLALAVLARQRGQGQLQSGGLAQWLQQGQRAAQQPSAIGGVLGGVFGR